MTNEIFSYNAICLELLTSSQSHDVTIDLQSSKTYYFNIWFHESRVPIQFNLKPRTQQ